MNKTRARIILTDDHPMLVEGLKTMLGRRFDVVGVAHSGQQLLDLLKTLDADCLLLDLGLPDRNGLDLIPDIRALRPQLRILIVTMHLDRVLADAVLHAGASGFIPKDSGQQELESAISAVLAGERYLSPRVPPITFSVGLGASNPALATLTPRQLEILGMIAQGKSTADIAAAVGVSESTITFHRANLRKKLGIDSEWGLVRFAILMEVGDAARREDSAAAGRKTPPGR